MDFNIRVYGLLFDDAGRVLLTDEFRLNRFMTKFPGGGLIPGEGTIDCLKREFLEEMNQEIEVVRHFYTTDYFQPTALTGKEMQLISIYYQVKLIGERKFGLSEKPLDIPAEDGAQAFRWADPAMLKEKDLSFPVDRKVLGMLQKKG